MIPQLCSDVTAWIKIRCFELWTLCVVWSIGFGGPVDRRTRRRDHRIAIDNDGELSVSVPSIIDIRQCVPSHCFRPQLWRSLYYVLKDVTFLIILYVCASLLETQPSKIMQYATIPVYWFLQGTTMWALFVLGHDCGHASFSQHSHLNDVIGTCLHTFLLVPYYPWKISHRHHHRNTSNIDRDEIFYPVRTRDRNNDQNLIHPVFGFGLSWLLYLLAGYKPRPVTHLNPMDPMFKGHHAGCVTSVACLCVWVCFLVVYVSRCGVLALISYYLIPLFVFTSWLVVVTFLHHMDTHIPWYSNSRWSNVKGQLSSIDRDYGWAQELTHNIGTHQVHHLFIKIPHYHLQEATFYFRNKFPHLEQSSSEPILPAFFRTFAIFDNQRHIGDDTLVHIYT